MNDLFSLLNRRIVATILSVFAASPVLFVYWKILDGKFWMLDDHIFIENSILTADNPSTFSRFQVMLQLNNVNLEANNLRITPTLNFYYAIRTFFFGTNPSPYFFLSFVIFLATAISLSLLIFLIAKEFKSPILNLYLVPLVTFMAFSLFTFPTIARNYVTLGVSEQIGPFFLIVTFNLLLLSYSKTRLIWSKTSAVLLPVNTIFLIGIKENYAAMSLLLLLLAGSTLSQMRKINRFSILLSISLNASFVILIGSRLLKSDTDVYGNSTSTSSFISSLSRVVINSNFILLLLCTVVTLYWLIRRDIGVPPVLLAPALLFLVDWTIYRGDIRDRYLTNSIVLIFLSISVMLLVSPLRSRTTLISGLAFAGLILMVNGQDAERVIQKQITATEVFDSGVNESVKATDIASDIALIGQTEWDYESVDSIATYLRSRSVVKPIYLYLPTSFEKKTGLYTQMKSWSANGSSYKFSPLLESDNSFDLCIYSQSKLTNYSELKCKREIVIGWLP